MDTHLKQAYGYAYKLNPKTYRDLVHDAYLHWYEKTGKNLFEEPNKRMIRVIKLTWYGYYINPRSKERKFARVSTEYKEHKSNMITPEDELIGKEFEQHMIESLSSEMQLEIYLYAVQGYKPFEIAKILGKGKPLMTYYFKKMAYTASLFN